MIKLLSKKNIDVLLMFLLVHGFYLVPPINSSVLAVGITIILGFVLKPKFVNDIVMILTNKKIVFIFLFIFIMIAASLIVSVLHATYDISYLKNLISQVVQVFMISFVLSYIFYDYKDSNYSDYLVYLIIWAFVIQSIVEITAFLVPSFASIVHLTYKKEVIKLMYEGYEGVRGLALTGSPGWGLAVGFGLSFLFFINSYIVNKRISPTTVFLGVLLILGAFFAGRSAFVGAILGIFYYIFSKGNTLVKIRNVFFGITVLIASVTAVYYLLPSFSQLLIEKVFPFVFEFYYSYESSGKAQTGSTDILIKMWSNPVSLETFLFGDGLFTDPLTGKYYMHTDVGYLRNMFFGGFFWVFLVVLYHLYLSSFHMFLDKKIEFNTKLFVFFLILYMLVLEAKAMSLGYNKYAFIILVSYMISWIYEKNNYKKSDL